MGVLPAGFRKLSKCVSNPLMESVVSAFHSVASTATVSARQAIGRRKIEQQGEIGDESCSRQSVGCPDLRLRQATSEDLIGVRRQKKTIDQHHHSLLQRRHDLTVDELRAGRHEEQRFSRSRSEERRLGKECRSRWSPYH